MPTLRLVLDGGPCDGAAYAWTGETYPDYLTGDGIRPDEYRGISGADGSELADAIAAMGAPHVYRFDAVTQEKRHELGHYVYVRPQKVK